MNRYVRISELRVILLTKSSHLIGSFPAAFDEIFAGVVNKYITMEKLGRTTHTILISNSTLSCDSLSSTQWLSAWEFDVSRRYLSCFPGYQL